MKQRQCHWDFTKTVLCLETMFFSFVLVTFVCFAAMIPGCCTT